MKVNLHTVICAAADLKHLLTGGRLAGMMNVGWRMKEILSVC